MATNKPTGDNARKGAVKKRTQLKNKLMGDAWTKRDKKSGEFMDVKPKKKFKGVRTEKPAKKAKKRKAKR